MNETPTCKNPATLSNDRVKAVLPEFKKLAVQVTVSQWRIGVPHVGNQGRAIPLAEGSNSQVAA
jgi:hypothetical protein